MKALINKLATFSLVVAFITTGFGCDVFLPDKGNEGQPCLDNGECKPGLVCQDGVCVEGSSDGGQGCETNEECEDDNPCTADLCVERNCTNTNLQNGTPCNDGNNCTVDDACQDGTCEGTDKDCSNMDGLCKVGVCFPDDGQCVQISADDNDPCNDGLYCTTDDHCESGSCVGTGLDCDDGDDCTIDACDESGDACQNTLDPGAGTTEGPVGDASCSNEVDDDCDGKTDEQDSECVSCTDNIDCNDSNPCTIDVCNSGQCTYQDMQNGTACNDGLYCTENDACLSGSCTGTGRDCRTLTDACNNGVCSESEDRCVAQPKANGTACDDGLYCTVSDQCSNGVCQLPQRDCDDANTCTTDSCDEDNSRCVHTMNPNPGAEGPQGDSTCSNGLDDDCDGQTDLADSDCVDCQTGSDCNDNNPCTLDECNSGVCSNTPQTGQNCNDGDDCTHTDKCEANGQCHGTIISCPDGTPPCGVVRTCNGTATCDETFPDSGVSCDDTDDCTHTDHCDGAGGCTGTLVTCQDDPDVCGYRRSCNGTATCDETYPTSSTSCDDDELCTYNDVCNGAGGCFGTTIQCTSDPGPCGMIKTCDGTATCDESYPDTNTTCDDGQYCTDGDHCNGSGGCLPGGADTCGTGWICYEDEDKCCLPEASRDCGANDNDIHWFDSCGHEGDVYSDCPDPNGECVNSVCQCIPHWTGQLCDACEAGWTGANCDVCVRYVDKGIAMSGSGLSWVDAFSDIQSGIDAAFQETQQSGGPDVCEVWVASGIYYIYEVARSDTVSLLPGVEVYGGFTTAMNDRSQRDWEAYLTVLNGWNQAKTSRVNTVVTGTDKSVLDGFLIYGGDAGTGNGGGMYNYLSSPRVENCIFLENKGGEGGGMANLTSAPTIKNCHFTGNEATWGGAIYNSSSMPLVEGCFFAGNNASYGGAIRSDESSGYLNNSILAGNWASQGAGSLAASIETVANCTFYANYPGGDGNSISVAGNSKWRNSIMWDTAVTGQAAHFNGVDVQYCDVYDSSGASVQGNGNIKSDPNFSSLANGSWAVISYSATAYQTSLSVLPRDWNMNEFKGMLLDPSPTAPGAYIIAGNDADSIFVWGDITDSVQPGDAFEVIDLTPPDRSPVIDVGDACSAPDTDMKGYHRMDDTSITNAGIGPPWVDMGALEWQDGDPSVPVDLLGTCCGNAYTLANHYYYVCPDALSWGVADFRCTIYGSYLVAISDATENTFVNSLLSGTTWLGASDIREEDVFEWSNGEPWVYQRWEAGQPDNSNNEDCLEMRTINSSWRDGDCRLARPFICEKPN